ncbi:MAG: family 78 glycoside hydrolase catalytic domain [Thermoguttaceae bacterium]|nr:family 78 glycoside hydrolase catalytic domain [Thermoguttaceae bacterium]
MKRLFGKNAALAFAFLAAASLTASSVGAAETSTLQPLGTTVETTANPVGVGTAKPRLSWKSKDASDGKGYALTQSAYRILVASTPEKLAADEGDVWDSGKVASDDSVFVEYNGAPLRSLQRYYWKVRVWDGADVASAWSEPATWLQGVVDPADWRGEWIGQPETVRPNVDLTGAAWIASEKEIESPQGFAPEYFRREFEIDRPASDFEAQNLVGTLYFAADQKCDLYVNGEKVGFTIGMAFNPDQLRSIDVSSYLRPGKNVVAVAVANDSKNNTGTKFGNGKVRPSALIAKLEVKTLDKSNAPKNLTTPNRFGVPAETLVSFATGTDWLASLEAIEGWNGLEFDAASSDAWSAAKVRYADADAGPWGKLRRRTEQVSPFFQKSFDVAKKVKSATLAVCAPGTFEAYLDGEKIGDAVLLPAFTRYDRRCLYNVFDVTDRFQNVAQDSPKKRELAFALGHGWYDVRSIVTWNFDAAPWRDFPRVRAWLELVFEDGTTETVATDSSWTYSTSPVVFDCIRQGEIVDGRWKREILGNAVVVPAPIANERITAQDVAPSRVTETFAAKSVKEVAPGVWVVDAGRDVAGWARVKLTGQEPGDVVRFRYSERVDDKGAVERSDIDLHFMEGTPANLTGYKGEFQSDVYFCNGADGETFEPRFTYNGFQYIEVVGLRQAPKPEDFTICVVNTDFASAGAFESSSELLNEVQKWTRYSYRGNYVAGYPTDCPHREKNGWTGDAQLACELAMYNWENTNGYEKWVADLRDEQKADGNLPGIVPTGDWGYPWGNGPAWDSALVMIPWYLYVYRGDVRVLEESFDAMKKYVDYVTSRELPSGIVAHGLGDWCPAKTTTPTEVTSTAFYYLDAKIVARTAKLLGKDADFERYSALAEKIRKSYNAAIYKGDGLYANESITSQACPIHQGVAAGLSEAEQAAAFERLVGAVEKASKRFDVGIFGAKYVLRTLSEGGRHDVALTMALQEEAPSYGYWIRNGAGTLWETWADTKGSSLNHIMFGDISTWFFQSLAGIKAAGAPDVVVAEVAPENVGFKRFIVEPKCGLNEIAAPGREPLTWVRGAFESPYGEIVSEWRWNDDRTKLTLNVVVPPNASACVVVPCDAKTQVCAATVGADFARRVDETRADAAVFEVGSGVYTFETTAK